MPSTVSSRTESPLAPLYRHINAHLANVADVPPAEGVRTLASMYEQRLLAVGHEESARTRIAFVGAIPDAMEQRFLLAWYLAERDVGLAPGTAKTRGRIAAEAIADSHIRW